MNPCPCGHLGNPLKACRCSPEQVQRYRNRLSGPLLDRIDLCVEVPLIPPAELAQRAAGESSAAVAARVAAARERAAARQGCVNALLDGRQLDQWAGAQPAALALLQRASSQLAWSPRAYQRCLRLARTVADLAGQDAIDPAAAAEAIQLRRGLDATA
jgi:magnesium chelatase family protein